MHALGEDLANCEGPSPWLRRRSGTKWIVSCWEPGICAVEEQMVSLYGEPTAVSGTLETDAALQHIESQLIRHGGARLYL